MVQLNFDTRDKAFAGATLDREFTLLPDGEYIAQIISTEKKQTRSGEDYLQISWQIIDGPHTRRQLFDSLYIYSPEKVKQLEFHRQRLFFITRACGLERISDTSELHHKPCRLTVRHDEYNGRTRNVISKYQPVTRITETQPQAAQQKADTFDGDLPF